jgi:hypothetical protein
MMYNCGYTAVYLYRVIFSQLSPSQGQTSPPDLEVTWCDPQAVHYADLMLFVNSRQVIYSPPSLEAVVDQEVV